MGLNIPLVKQKITDKTSQLLSKELGCKVSVSDVYLNLFNHVDLENLCVYDQQQKALLKSSHIGAEISLNSLFDKKIQIKHLETFNTNLNLYKVDKDSTLNFQFIIDKLNNDSDKTEGLDLLINTLIVRNLNIKYNILNTPYTNYKFNTNHININNFDANLRINSLTKDSLDVRVRDIRFKELSSITLKHLAFHLISGKNVSKISGFNLNTQQSSLNTSDIIVEHKTNNWKDIFNGIIKPTNLRADITPSEFHSFIPELKNLGSESFELSFDLNKSSDVAYFSTLVNKKNSADLLSININSSIDIPSLINKHIVLHSNINNFNIDSKQLSKWLNAFSVENNPISLEKLENINHKGTIDIKDKNIKSDGITSFQNCQIKHELCCIDNDINANIETSQLNLGLLTDIKEFGIINSKSKINGNVKKKDINFNSNISELIYNNYSYKDFKAEGQLKDNILTTIATINDINAKIKAEGNVALDNSKQIDTKIHVEQFSPSALNLTKEFGNAVFTGDFSINYENLSPSPLGNISINNFVIQKDSTTYAIDNLSLNLFHRNGEYCSILSSDFADATLISNTDYPTLFNIIKTQINKHISIFDIVNNKSDAVANFNMQIKKSDLLENVLNLPLHINENAHINANINTETGKLRMTAIFPSFDWKGSNYNNTSLFINELKDSLTLLTQTTKHFNEDNVKIELNAAAANNVISSHIKWKDIDNKGFQGDLSTQTTISTDKNNKGVQIQISPSNILIDDSVWTINKSSIDLRNNDFHINNFRLGHDNRFVSMHTIPTNNGGKLLDVQLNDIDLDYIFNLLDFHPVYFSGKASGRVLTSDLNEKKDFDADLTVKDFLFNYGEMGTLKLKGGWRNDEKRVLLDAITQRTSKDSTLIKGYVDIDEDCLDLNITSRKTSLQFLRFYLGSIFKNLTGYCNGNLRVYGPLDSINLAGDERIDSLYLFPISLNTPFMIHNDSLHFRPGRFIFDKVTLNDPKGNPVVVNGNVTHRVLHDFGFNFNFDYNNALIYDWKDYETSGFWGTVYATGDAQMNGTPDDVHINVNVTPNKKTQFVYDSSNSESSGNKEFIHFKDPFFYMTKTQQDKTRNVEKEVGKKDNSADIYINFNINAVPDADFTILTDKKTGDNMNLNGSGNLHATFYNKGRFMMYGTYTVDHGFYKITIQDIIHKNFKMQSGGTLRFNGEPFEGEINMRGKYNVSSVSLSDLNLGGNMNNSTTSIDCILNFNGKAGEPKVSFDIDFPSNIGSDEQNMVRNIISSQGDMTMQVIYLLSVGRFYTYDYSTFAMAGTQDQSSLAMNSLLANTLSGQINNMLSNALHIENWNFGTNLATGRMGWDDMEVEGTLSGSLLKNRLLFDGKFGYRDNTVNTYSNDFVGDFYLRYLLNKSGTISLKAYSETNDRYFTKSSLTTNGAGIVFQRDFNSLRDFFVPLRKEGKKRKSK